MGIGQAPKDSAKEYTPRMRVEANREQILLEATTYDKGPYAEDDFSRQGRLSKERLDAASKFAEKYLSYTFATDGGGGTTRHYLFPDGHGSSDFPAAAEAWAEVARTSTK